MNKQDLWKIVVDQYLDHIEDSDAEVHIKLALNTAGEDIKKAMELFRASGWARIYGNCAVGMPSKPDQQGYHWEVLGDAITNPINAWLGDPRKGVREGEIWRSPDLVITWPEVFVYVRRGRLMVYQYSMLDFR